MESASVYFVLELNNHWIIVVNMYNRYQLLNP